MKLPASVSEPLSASSLLSPFSPPVLTSSHEDRFTHGGRGDKEKRTGTAAVTVHQQSSCSLIFVVVCFFRLSLAGVVLPRAQAKAKQRKQRKRKTLELHESLRSRSLKRDSQSCEHSAYTLPCLMPPRTDSQKKKEERLAPYRSKRTRFWWEVVTIGSQDRKSAHRNDSDCHTGALKDNQNTKHEFANQTHTKFVPSRKQ